MKATLSQVAKIIAVTARKHGWVGELSHISPMTLAVWLGRGDLLAGPLIITQAELNKQETHEQVLALIEARLNNLARLYGEESYRRPLAEPVEPLIYHSLLDDPPQWLVWGFWAVFSGLIIWAVVA